MCVCAELLTIHFKQLTSIPIPHEKRIANNNTNTERKIYCLKQ